MRKIIAKMQKEVYDFNRKMQQEIYYGFREKIEKLLHGCAANDKM